MKERKTSTTLITDKKATDNSVQSTPDWSNEGKDVNS